MKYAVVPAEGRYGDFADVVSTHATRAAAEKAAGEGWQVVEVGDGVNKGDRLPRIDVKAQRHGEQCGGEK